MSETSESESLPVIRGKRASLSQIRELGVANIEVEPKMAADPRYGVHAILCLEVFSSTRMISSAVKVVNKTNIAGKDVLVVSPTVFLT